MSEQNPLDRVIAYLDALMGKDFETAASYMAGTSFSRVRSGSTSRSVRF
jgi:hypothetical protein